MDNKTKEFETQKKLICEQTAEYLKQIAIERADHIKEIARERDCTATEKKRADEEVVTTRLKLEVMTRFIGRLETMTPRETRKFAQKIDILPAPNALLPAANPPSTSGSLILLLGNVPVLAAPMSGGLQVAPQVAPAMTLPDQLDSDVLHVDVIQGR